MLIDPNRLRAALGVLGVSQADLARASGISVTTVSLVLAGKRIPSRRIAVRLVTGLEAAFKINGGRLDTSYFVAEKHDKFTELPN